MSGDRLSPWNTPRSILNEGVHQLFVFTARKVSISNGDIGKKLVK